MLLVSTKQTGIFRKGKYQFTPGKPVEVNNSDDIADLLQKSFIKKFLKDKEKITYIDEIINKSKKENVDYNIGIIRFGGIGDCIMLHGITGCIKRDYPLSYITVYIIKSLECRMLLECSEYIDKIIECSNRDSVIKTEERLKDKHNVLYSMHLDVRKYQENKLTIEGKINIKGNSIYKQTLAILNIESDYNCLPINISDKYDKFSVLLNKYIVIHVGSGHLRKYKQWSIKSWNKVIEYLSKYVKIIQVGMEYDDKVNNAIDLRGKTNILETGWLVKNAHFVLGVDSGIIHLARSQGTKSIALYGPTSKEMWGYSENYNIQTDKCKSCWRTGGEWWNSCTKNNICMSSISSDNIKEIAKKLLNKEKERIINNNEYDFVICITTKNRANMCYNLLNQLSKYANKYKIKVILINDASEQDYNKVIKLIKENNWIYAKHKKEYGKINYWRTLNEEWSIAKNFNFKWLVQLCDDYEICESFFDKIIMYWNDLKGEFALNIWLDNRILSNIVMWGMKIKEVFFKYKYYETGWVDGGHVFCRDTMNKLSWQINPITFPEKKYIHKMCSGVWEQISKRLGKNNCKIFCPEYSLVNHIGNVDSKMNKSNREKEKIKSIGFNGKSIELKKKIGIIARCNHTGLGIVAREFRNNLKINSYFAIDECSNKNATFRKDWIQDKQWVSKIPVSDKLIKNWLDTNKIEVLFTIEKPYNDNLYKIAHEKGIKNILMPNWEWFRLGSSIYKDIDLFVAPTEYCYKMLRENGYNNSIYIPHPINTEYLKYKQRKRQPKVFIHNSGLGEVSYRKSTQEVIEAFSKLHKDLDVKLIIRNQTNKDFEFSDSRIECIVADTKEYKDCYTVGDIAIQPSKWEGVGLTILESMSCGIPVITTDSFPMNEYGVDSSLLVKVDRYEIAKIANSKLKAAIINIDSLYKTMQMILEIDISYLSYLSRKKMEEVYSWNIIKNVWIDAINKL